MTTLGALFDTHGSDKGSVPARDGVEAHYYADDYARLIPRDTPRLVELGVGCRVCDPHALEPMPWNGRAGSVRAWLEWLPEASVVGVDYDRPPADLMAHPRFAFIQGDLREPAFVEALPPRIRWASVIIDDASHDSRDQWLALKALWPCVAPDGLYVIEDAHLRLGPAPWPYDELPKDARFGGYIGRTQHGVVLRKRP